MRLLSWIWCLYFYLRKPYNAAKPLAYVDAENRINNKYTKQGKNSTNVCGNSWHITIITARRLCFFKTCLTIVRLAIKRRNLSQWAEQGHTETWWITFQFIYWHHVICANCERRKAKRFLHCVSYRLEFTRCSRAMHVPRSLNEFIWFAW